MDREYWTKDQWQEYQNEQLRIFVEHCYKNVPYYREQFDLIKLSPRDIITVSDLHKIPILTKEVVRQNTDKLLARNYNVQKLTKGHTTGSTGSPLTYYKDKNRIAYLNAGLWRIYSRCGWKPGERIAAIWGFNQKAITTPQWRISIRDFFNGTTRLNAWKANEADFEKWFKLIKKQKVTLIVCYASSGSRFAKWILDNNLFLEGIKGVYCTSEKLYPQQKQQMEEAFRCTVYNLYGCGEVNNIACTCEKGNMHINPDMAIIEFGQSDAIEQSPIIMTGFRNLAMPFLRYVNGDSGFLSQNTCSCGRQSPLLDLNVSRLADVFTFADGKKYPSLYFVLRLYKSGFEGVELFQFHQDTLDHIWLRIVKNAKFNGQTENKLNEIIQEIEGHIGHQAKVELSFVDYIEQSITSKHYYAKSDVKIN